MKSTTTLGIALAVGTLGSLGAAPQALADPFTNHSGTICKNYNAGEADFIDYLAKGTRSRKNGATSVICPLTRDTIAGNGGGVYVDISHSSNATTTCTAFSHDTRGNQLAAASGTFTGTGFKEIFIPLIGAGKSQSFSDYSVLCVIPGNYHGLILGVDLIEL